MFNKRKLSTYDFFEIQDKLNCMMAGNNWRNELTREQVQVQIMMEGAELLESGISYKWWGPSKAPMDYWNIKIEAVDILHFFLTRSMIDKEEHRERIFSFDENNPCYDVSGRLDHSRFMRLMTDLMGGSDVVVTNAISTLASCFDMSHEEISAIYVAKATLNEIRMSNGYKSGKYVKVVDGIEDNVRLETLVRSFMRDGDITLDTLSTSVKDAFFVETS